MKDNEQIRFFLGSNSPLGFFSRFDQLTDPHRMRRLFVIKGGPGGGKSTLMRKVAQSVQELGDPVEYIHCSSDADSLDAVIFPVQGAAVVDGTRPHFIEPKYWGVFETIVPLFACLDEQQLCCRREEIIALTDQCSRAHEQCCRFLSAAGAVQADTARIVSSFTNTEKIHRLAARLAAREFRPAGGQPGHESIRMLSAVSDQGLRLFDETAPHLAGRICLVEDEYGVSAKTLLGDLRDLALAAGYDTVTCYCPLAPAEKIDHLFIPALSLGFMTSNRFLQPRVEPYKVINARRFTDPAELKAHRSRLSFNRKILSQMLSEAVGMVAEAKEIHSELEKYYVAAMNFSMANILAEDIASQVRSLTDEGDCL